MLGRHVRGGWGNAIDSIVSLGSVLSGTHLERSVVVAFDRRFASEHFAAAAAELVGEDKVTRTNQPGMGSEDFSFMMQQVPGAYLHVGNGDSASVHNQHYNFNDEAIPYGAALLARVIERELPRGQVG